MKIYTTLNRIKQENPCGRGWMQLLTFLNKTQADDEPLDLLTILESNGVHDCLWAFQCTDNFDSIYRHMAADFAESVLHIFEAKYPNDNRLRLAIQAARDYADGKISKDAWAAASDAASDAAWDAAWAAASDAASDAAWAAARAAASDAAWAAASDAAWAAARAATRDSMYAASDAAWAAARAANSAANAAELEKQKSIIIKYLS